MFKKTKILSILITTTVITLPSLFLENQSNIIAMESYVDEQPLTKDDFDSLVNQLVCLELSETQRNTLIQFITKGYAFPSQKELIEKLNLSEEQQVQLVNMQTQEENAQVVQSKCSTLKLNKITENNLSLYNEKTIRSMLLNEFKNKYLNSNYLEKFAKNDSK